MEVDVSDGEDLGFNGLVRILDGDKGATPSARSPIRARPVRVERHGHATAAPTARSDDLAAAARTSTTPSRCWARCSPASNPTSFVTVASGEAGSTLIQAVIRASASLQRHQHPLRAATSSPPTTRRPRSRSATTSRSSRAACSPRRHRHATGSNLATSVNVERQDIGVTLRVTPQISEGDTLRLEIFQEITDVNAALSGVTGNPEEVGVSLSSRKVENTVVVVERRDRRDRRPDQRQVRGQREQGAVARRHPVPRLAVQDAPSKTLSKTNLLVFLTPHIVRAPQDLERETIRKREEFWQTLRGGAPAPGAASRRRPTSAVPRPRPPASPPRPTPAATPCAASSSSTRRATRSSACARSRSRASEARRRAEEEAAAAKHAPGLRGAGGGLPQRAGGARSCSPSWSTPATTARSSPPRAAARVLYEIRARPVRGR